MDKLTEHYSGIIDTSKEEANEIKATVITKIEGEPDNKASLKVKWCEAWQTAKTQGERVATNLAAQRKRKRSDAPNLDNEDDTDEVCKSIKCTDTKNSTYPLALGRQRTSTTKETSNQETSTKLEEPKRQRPSKRPLPRRKRKLERRKRQRQSLKRTSLRETET